MACRFDSNGTLYKSFKVIFWANLFNSREVDIATKNSK